MATAQYTIQDKATLIRCIVDQLVSLKLIQDLNAEIELRFVDSAGNTNILYKGRPKGIVLDKLDDQSFGLLVKAFSKNVQPDPSSEVQSSSIFVYADKKPMLSVDRRTGKVNALNVPLRETQRQTATTQISPVQQEVFNRIIQSVERTKASPVRNFITQLLKDIATAPQRGQQRQADERMAKTATTLLGNFGKLEDGKLVYQAAGYSIEKQADRTTIRDSKGTKILQYTDSLVGSRIIMSKVADDTRYEFKAAKKQIANGIALDPLERSRQLGKLAPALEIGISQAIGRLQVKEAAIYNANWIVEAAVTLLERYGTVTGKDTLAYEDPSLYSFQQDANKNDLSIADKNGKVLLEMKGGQLTNNQLEPQDIRNFGILQDYLMKNPVEKGSIFQDVEARYQVPEPPLRELQPQQRSTATANVPNYSQATEGQVAEFPQSVLPRQSQQIPEQPTELEQSRASMSAVEQGSQSQGTEQAKQIYSAANYLLESYGNDLGSTARTYMAKVEVTKSQRQESASTTSQSQTVEAQNSSPTRRVISAYNEALSAYEDNADRKAATDKIYSGVSLVSVSNVQDVDGDKSPELCKSERPTFYAIQDGQDYLVLPIPAMASMKSTYLRSMYDVAGDEPRLESIREPARFRADSQGNLLLVQKGSLITEGGKESDLPSRSNGNLAKNKVSSNESTTKAGIRSVEILRDYEKNTFSMSVTEPGETSRNVLLIDTKDGIVINSDIRPQDFQYLEELITQQQSQSLEKGDQLDLAS
jgi:hypothetical protein